MRNGGPTIDALVSLTGFSLVGGPAYNDAKARRGNPGANSTCPTSPRTRSSSRRSSNGSIRARSVAGRSDHDGRDPRARRRTGADGVRRPLDGAEALHGLRARLHLPDAERPRHASCAERAERLARASRSSSRCAAPSAPSARSRSSCSTSRRTAAQPAPRRTWRSSNRCIKTLKAMKARATRSKCRPSVDALRERSSAATPSAFGTAANVTRAFPSTTTSAARR